MSYFKRTLVVIAALALALPAVAAARYSTGIGDQQTQMFTSPLWLQLHTPISRYIAPYDAAVSPRDKVLATAWIRAAEARHQRILIAFYHSERTPTRLPSVALYRSDVAKFIKLFPEIREYQAYNEANRGNVRGAFSSPSAQTDAKYYAALRRVAHGRTVVGLDVLDAVNIRPTLNYIKAFYRELRHLRVRAPSITGLHNYSDTNRYSSSRTRAVVRAVHGQVWLTETGGVVKFGRAFPNRHGSGLRRAVKALAFMFRLAASNRRITRLYIFQWSGAAATARFDAGLLDKRYRPRPGYVEVCRHLRAKNCRVRTVND